jgi:hypothetical protein
VWFQGLRSLLVKLSTLNPRTTVAAVDLGGNKGEANPAAAAASPATAAAPWLLLLLLLLLRV